MLLKIKSYFIHILAILIFLVTDLILIKAIHSDSTIFTQEIIFNRINGDSKTIIPHLYQIANYPHLLQIFDQYKALRLPCLVIKDNQGGYIFKTKKHSCSKKIIAKNYLDQKVLQIEFDFPEKSILSSLKPKKVLIINILLIQIGLIISIFLIYKYRLNLEKIAFFELNLMKNEIQNKENLAKQARQFAHDIRSPITALNMAIRDLSSLPEERKFIIKGSVTRINDIANNLLEKYKHPVEPNGGVKERPNLSSQHIISVLNSIISEKRIQNRDEQDIQIEFCPSSKSYGLFSMINSFEFQKIISNILNNSFEAFEKFGNLENLKTFENFEFLNSSLIAPKMIQISLTEEGNQLLIKIKDNGKGIPKEILGSLGEEGKTFGKVKGNGLGLYHAKKTVESWGGNLTINSKENFGTEIILGLTRTTPPKWFVPHIMIKKNSKIVIVDDDPSIHQAWTNSFNITDFGKLSVEIYHFSNFFHFKQWALKDGIIGQTLFLFDYEISNEEITGIDMVKEFNLNHKAYLVTGSFDDLDIIKRCEQIGLGIIPKTMISFLPIMIRSVEKDVKA